MTIDQSLLPRRVKWLRFTDGTSVIAAIKTMKIRGAPVIGAAAAYALALEANLRAVKTRHELLRRLRSTSSSLESARPTGRDLHYAAERVVKAARTGQSLDEVRCLAIEEAQEIANEQVAIGRRLTDIGQQLIRDGDRILTHCNSGELATVEYGTALGAIIRGWRKGKRVSVIATETRPLLQGARLSAWELKRAGVPFKLITDGMVAHVISQKMVDKVMVGADRVWPDGSIANKIGTLTIALVAREYGVPFYVVAPISSFDFVGEPDLRVIEHRNPKEVLEFNGKRIAPAGIQALNPAFDITPARYVSAIATEYGIVRPPFRPGLRRLKQRRPL